MIKGRRGSAQLALLIDFGSTYTKAAVVDLEEASLVASGRAPTTAHTDITKGLRQALRSIVDQLGTGVTFVERWACSSAAGGLRMVAIGLVPDLTAEAARRAALGAGARVLKTFAYRLSDDDVREIKALDPDVILLSGGTDGGHRDTPLWNAGRLAAGRCRAPVIVACNGEVADEAVHVLRQAGITARAASNVMPRLGTLAVDGAREAIRQLFLERIVDAKGLRRAERYVEGVVLPTPAAVLAAAQLLQGGYGEERGFGELIVVDVGGATTDVHSVAAGLPREPGVTVKGLPEPFAKRTVEGDLGVRVSAPALVEAVGARVIGAAVGMSEQEVIERAANLARNPAQLASSERERAFDTALARAAVAEAVRRHAGRLEEKATPAGIRRFQRGKDLRGVPVVIGTGGVIVHHPRPEQVLAGAVCSGERGVLVPESPVLLVDKFYLLAAAGLLARSRPAVAFALMKRHLRKAGEAHDGAVLPASG